MTDPGVDMFCAQICSVGIITGSGPSISSKGSQQRSVVGEQCTGATSILRKRGGEGGGMKREDSRLPWCRVDLISHFGAQTVNTLLFHLCSWPEPVTSPWSLMILSRSPAQGCRAGGTARSRPCNSQASRSPATVYWFLFPPISRREAKKRLKTLSVWSWIRILHRGDTLESTGSQLRYELWISL